MSLYKVGGFSFVLDGHHRVSVARYHEVEWIDAYVTEFGAGEVWSDPTRDTGEGGRTEPASKGGEPRMHEMMDSQLAKRRREELLREVEMNRRARALRATRKRHAGRRSTLVWEMKRYAGRIFKRLRNAG